MNFHKCDKALARETNNYQHTQSLPSSTYPSSHYPHAKETIIQTAYSIGFTCLCILYEWKHRIYNIFFCVMHPPFALTVLLSCTQPLWGENPLWTVTRLSALTRGPAQIQVGHICLHLALAPWHLTRQPGAASRSEGWVHFAALVSIPSLPLIYKLLWPWLYFLPYGNPELFMRSHNGIFDIFLLSIDIDVCNICRYSLDKYKLRKWTLLSKKCASNYNYLYKYPLNPIIQSIC